MLSPNYRILLALYIHIIYFCLIVNEALTNVNKQAISCKQKRSQTLTVMFTSVNP